jgi:hypothetical protein
MWVPKSVVKTSPHAKRKKNRANPKSCEQTGGFVQHATLRGIKSIDKGSWSGHIGTQMTELTAIDC